jgi:hypothetical protein
MNPLLEDIPCSASCRGAHPKQTRTVSGIDFMLEIDGDLSA